MAAPTPSDLDFSQVLQGSYDEANGRLRVDAAITAPLDVNGEVLVDIRASDGDSVIVYGTQDGTPTGTIQPLKINPDGSIDVVVSESTLPRNVISNFSSITSVVSGSLTTILSYTVPPAKVTFLSNVEVSGTNIATYGVYINGVLNARQRTMWGAPFNSLFNYSTGTIDSGFELSAGTVLTIQVIHQQPSTGDFDAKLLAIEQG